MTARDLAPIDPTALYPKPALQRAAGWGDDAFAEARRAGLKVHYVHGRAFILGAHAIEYVLANGKAEKDAAR